MKSHLKKKLFVIGAILGLIEIAVLLKSQNKETMKAQAVLKGNLPSLATSNPARLIKPHQIMTVTEANTKFENEFYKKFFQEKLLKQPVISTNYYKLKSELPNSKNADLISMFIAKGFIHDSSAEYSAFTAQIYNEIKVNSQDIFKIIDANYKIFQRDQFAFQVMINMAANLEISNTQKARLLGSALSEKFQINSNGSISAESASMTIAWILMKKNGLSESDVRPYFLLGLKKNNSDPIARKEFVTRAKVYYPTL